MINQQILNDLNKFHPELFLSVSICVLLIVELFVRKKTKISGILAFISLFVTFILTIQQSYIETGTIFFQMLALDPFGFYFKILILISAAVIIFFTLFSEEINKIDYKTQEYYSLILCMTLGGFLMVSSVNLLMMYLSLELLSLSSYVLSGYLKKSNRSVEAALKYVIYGGVSSGLMLFGISLIYGLTGSINFYQISTFLSSNPVNVITLLIAIFLMIAGFGYKISAVPFHFWTPDVYEGAPLPITALLSVASKAAGFGMLIRFFIVSFQYTGTQTHPGFNLLPGFSWNQIFAVIAVATMTLGNFVAIWQDNLKRLLAYSSIAQAGYIILAFVTVTPQGISSMMLYLFIYLFMNLGAFYSVILIANKFGTESINEMKGYGYRAPFLCVSFGIFLFSLTGIPLTAGFVGKFYIFSALISDGYIWLALIGLLNSVVSLYYYVKVIKNMFLLNPQGDSSSVKYSLAHNTLLILLIIPTILFGIYFSPIVKFAEDSAKLFGIK
jgi:NADH-quinone oxidoreductase subunit N